MNYKKDKISVITSVILISLCLVALAISIRVTKTILEKNQQIVRNRPSIIAEVSVDDYYKTIDSGRLSDFILNYNGKIISSVKAFISNDKYILISFDSLLDVLGIGFNYFASDDILKTQISNEQLIIKLGETSFKYGDKEYKLSVAPIAAKEHILVPLDLFDHLKGFGTDVSYLKGISFLYNYQANDAITNSEPFFFTIDNKDIAQLTDSNGKQIAEVSEKMLQEKSGYSLQISGSGNTLLLHMNNKIYLAGNGNKLYSVDVGLNATLSEDEKYLYWIDVNDGTAYIYDIETKTTKALGDFYTKIDNGDRDLFQSNVFNIVYDYIEDSSYIRIILTNYKHSKYYAYVQSKNAILVGTEVKVSSDKTCLLYRSDNEYKVLEKYKLSAQNLGEADSVDWISNSLIQLKNDEKVDVITKNGNKQDPTEEKYKLIGRTGNLTNGILYAVGSEIFYEERGETEKLTYLNIDYDYFSGSSSKGPFIAVSRLSDSVFFLKDNKRVRIGSAKKLLINIGDTDLIDKYEKCINLSPDGIYYSLLMYENEMLNLLLINNTTFTSIKLILDISVNDLSRLNNIKLKWLSNTKMVVSSSTNALIIDISTTVNTRKIILPKAELKSVLIAH